MTLREASALSDRFYEAALDEALWDGVLQSYAEAFGGVGTVILEPGSASPIASVSNGLRESVRAYNDGWWREDVIVSTAQRLKLNRPGVLWDDDFLPAEMKVKNLYFQDFLRPLGVGSVATVVTQPHGGASLAINVQRRFGLPPSGREERRRFADASRHLTRALAVRMRLGQAEAARAALSRGLSDFDCAVAITDTTGRVLEINEAFASLAPQGLAIRQGRIHLSAIGMQGRFDAVLHAVSSGTPDHGVPDTLVVPRPSELLPLLVRVTPLEGRAAERFGGLRPTHGALVLVLDPSHVAYPDLTQALTMLGLTPAQARVALLVAAGHPTKGVADVLAISDETVRAHLKAIFARLGLSRQSDIVRLVVRSAPFGG